MTFTKKGKVKWILDRSQTANSVFPELRQCYRPFFYFSPSTEKETEDNEWHY